MRIIRPLAGAVLVLATLSFFSGPAAAQDNARIHLIHGIPDTDVDVAAGGSNVFSFSDTQDLSALAGQTLEDLQVKVAGTDTVAIDAGDVTLPTSGNTTIIAHLDASGTPILSIFDNDVSTTGAGQGRLIVRHTAFAPEVDIRANGNVAFANVANGAEGSADLPAGTVTAEVVPAGADTPVVIGPADLPIVEGEALIVYAVGSLDAGNLSVLTESIEGLHNTPTLVNTGNSPIESSSSLGLIAAAGFVATVLLGLGRRRLAYVKA
jgi:hypothetical protein